MTSDLSIGVHDACLAPVIPTRHRHRHRPCLAAGRRGRCCRGGADLRAPERLRSGRDHGFDRASTETFTPFGLLRLQNPQPRPPTGASSNEQPSEPARIVDVERQKYLTPNSSCLTAAYSPASRAPRRRSGPPGRSSPSWRRWRLPGCRPKVKEPLWLSTLNAVRLTPPHGAPPSSGAGPDPFQPAPRRFLRPRLPPVLPSGRWRWNQTT